jgi:hypothetical protein
MYTFSYGEVGTLHRISCYPYYFVNSVMPFFLQMITPPLRRGIGKISLQLVRQLICIPGRMRTRIYIFLEGFSFIESFRFFLNTSPAIA